MVLSECFVSWKSTFDNSLSWDVDVKENVKDFVEGKYIAIIIVIVLSPSPNSFRTLSVRVTLCSVIQSKWVLWSSLWRFYNWRFWGFHRWDCRNVRVEKRAIQHVPNHQEGPGLWSSVGMLHRCMRSSAHLKMLKELFTQEWKSLLKRCSKIVPLITSSLFLQITSAADSEAITYQKLVKGHAYSLTGAIEVIYLSVFLFFWEGGALTLLFR